MTLQLLEHETRAQRERLRRCVDLPRRFASLIEYRALLQRLAGFYAACEADLERFETLLAGIFPSRQWRMAPLIREDLEALGMTAAAIDALPMPAGGRAATSRADALGAAYALLVAPLGGYGVPRELREKLGIGDGRGMTFFASERVCADRRTAALQPKAELFLNGPIQQRAMVEAAIDTIRALESWIATADSMHSGSAPPADDWRVIGRAPIAESRTAL